MRYDINKFADKFKKAINWMLRNKYGQEIKKDLKIFKKNKSRLTTKPDSVEALHIIVDLIRTNSWRLKKSDTEIKSFIRKHHENFRTEQAKKELIGIVGGRRKKNIEQLFAYPTLKKFTEELYNLARQGKTDVIGEKGRDNYLRDFGYWDRIPMDRHEMRFIIRSGIYQACSSNDKRDPLERNDLHDALSRFCANYLGGYKVEGIELGSAPGIVDIFIWSFSAEDRYNLCGAVPECNGCNLNSVCLYAITNSL